MEPFLVRVCLCWGLSDKNPAVLFAAWKCVCYFSVLLRLRPELFCLKMSDVWHPRAPASWVIITRLLASLSINTTFNRYMCVCAANISSISGWSLNSGAITCTCRKNEIEMLLLPSVLVTSVVRFTNAFCCFVLLNSLLYGLLWTCTRSVCGLCDNLGLAEVWFPAITEQHDETNDIQKYLRRARTDRSRTCVVAVRTQNRAPSSHVTFANEVKCHWKAVIRDSRTHNADDRKEERTSARQRQVAVLHPGR